MLTTEMIGRRVSVRYRRDATDGPTWTDAVGGLLALSDQAAIVAAQSGEVRIPLNDILTARPVSAAPRDVLALQRVANAGWRAAEQVEVGGWLLRADAGWTARANSALLVTNRGPVADRLPVALSEVRSFYTERGLPTLVQIPLPGRQSLDAELAGLGWTQHRPAVVLTTPVPAVPSPKPSNVKMDSEPDDGWLFCLQPAATPEVARSLLSRHRRARLASWRDGEAALGVGRGAIDDGWLGISAVRVQPEHRGRGIATCLVTELMRWALAEGARNCYVQVDPGNDAALRLYHRLGFSEHHRYHYRRAPD